MLTRCGKAKLYRLLTTALVATVPALSLSACQPQTDAAAPAARPVRTTTVEKRETGQALTFTGRIEAEDEVNVAFRISGRLLENNGKLGDRVQAGQVMARLEPQNELNTLRQAQAGLAAAQGQLTQARNHFDRQETLLAQGWTTRANFDVATQAQQTAQSQVDAAEAQLRTAHDLVSFTELKADAPGTITATGPSAGEVVQAGQMIARLARKDGARCGFRRSRPATSIDNERSPDNGKPDRRSVSQKRRVESARSLPRPILSPGPLRSRSA